MFYMQRSNVKVCIKFHYYILCFTIYSLILSQPRIIYIHNRTRECHCFLISFVIFISVQSFSCCFQREVRNIRLFGFWWALCRWKCRRVCGAIIRTNGERKHEKWKKTRGSYSKKPSISTCYSKERVGIDRGCLYREGISTFRGNVGRVRLIIFRKIFHKNDSITCGDVRPRTIMLFHFIRCDWTWLFMTNFSINSIN